MKIADIEQKEWIYFIGGSWEQRPAIERAKSDGYNILLSDISEACEAKDFADEFQRIDPRNLDEILTFARQRRVINIIGESCDYCRYAAVYALVALDFEPLVFLDPLQRLSNKGVMRDHLRTSGVFQPRYFRCRYFSDARKAVDSIDLPVVIKPVDSRGSQGVRIVTDEGDLKSSFLDAVAMSQSREVLIEAFVAGTHFTVDGFVDEAGDLKILGVAVKTLVENNGHPVITRVDYGSELADGTRRDLCEATSKAVSSLNIGHGLIHAEFIIDSNGRVFFLEIANRGGGVLTAQLVLPKLTGLDVIEYLIKNRTNTNSRQASMYYQPKCMVAIVFLNVGEGRIDSIQNENVKLVNDHILYASVWVREGQIIGAPFNGVTRHGVIIVTGKSKGEIDETLHDYLDRLKVVFK